MLRFMTLTSWCLSVLRMLLLVLVGRNRLELILVVIRLSFVASVVRAGLLSKFVCSSVPVRVAFRWTLQGVRV